MTENARHSSATVEHYTPAHIVEAARKLLGNIDFDPASCARANEIIRARGYWTKEDGDKWTRADWGGRVFCNPPGGKTAGKSNQKAWWFRLAQQWMQGTTAAAVFVCFSVELLQTTQVKTPDGLPLPLDFPICFPSSRVAYTREDGSGSSQPPHASAIIYLPPHAQTYETALADLTAVFGGIGACR